MPSSHMLEAFIRDTVDKNVKWILSEIDQVQQPVHTLFLWSDQSRLEVIAAIINDHEVVHGDFPRETTLPLEDREDPLLRDFLRTHGLDEDHDWSGDAELPDDIYRMEMIGAAKAVARVLKDKGIAFTEDAEIGIRLEDEDYVDILDFMDPVREQLTALDREVALGYIAVFYADPENQVARLLTAAN